MADPKGQTRAGKWVGLTGKRKVGWSADKTVVAMGERMAVGTVGRRVQ